MLAESGGTPHQVTALVSNPLNPGDWSDEVAEIFDLPFEWLAHPEYNTTAARDHFCEVQKVYEALFRPKGVGRLSESVFSKYGVGQQDAIPDAIREQALGELFDRAARHMVGIPYETSVTEDHLRKALETKATTKSRCSTLKHKSKRISQVGTSKTSVVTITSRFGSEGLPFSRTGDPATGDFGDAIIIKKFGEVPDDLSTL